MNRLTPLFCAVLILSGCVSYPVAKNPELTVVLFNGDGENVEVFYGKDRIIELQNIKTNYDNVASIKKVKRVRGKVQLKVAINGKTAGFFSLNAQRIGVVYLFITPEGSVILEDGVNNTR